MTSPPPSPRAETQGPPLAALARIVHSDLCLTSVLQRVADLARGAIPHVAEASVTVIEEGRPSTVVFTGRLAVVLDERQYADGFGPCTDAAATGQTILVDTSDAGGSYPDFAALAASHGIRHVLAVGLPLGQRVIGALNLYSDVATPFAVGCVKEAEEFAAYAAVAVANAAAFQATSQEVRHLHAAMLSRSVIEQAKGIVMARQGCSPDEAFAVLTRLSQSRNVKLRDVAASLVAGAVTER
jgi:GAF domain-containing protein